MALQPTKKGLFRASVIASLFLVTACGEPAPPPAYAPYADQIHYQASYGRSR